MRGITQLQHPLSQAEHTYTPQGLRDRKLVEKRHQLDAVDKLIPIAKDLNCDLAPMAIAWCAKNTNVSTVITGATRVEQIKDNMKALELLPHLTQEHVELIASVANGAA